MNISLIKKFFGQFNPWTQSTKLLQSNFFGLLLLGMVLGNTQPICASVLPSQFNPIFSIEATLIAQVSLPKSVETSIRQDLSRRTKIKRDKFTIQQFSRQTWPDGCLGLGGANELCTQALVEGWRVVMSYQGKTWVYRSDDTGMVVRLEK
jgi:hypothetical protein